MQGLSIDSAVAGFQTFVKKVHKIDPAIKIVYLGITTTPFCYSSNISNAVVKIKEVNRLVQEYCESIPDKITFVSTEDLKKNWVKNSDFYLGDRHHINDEGHRMMGKLLLPVLENAIRSSDPTIKVAEPIHNTAVGAEIIHNNSMFQKS